MHVVLGARCAHTSSAFDYDYRILLVTCLRKMKLFIRHCINTAPRLMKIMNGKWLGIKERREEKIAHMIIMATAAAAAATRKNQKIIRESYYLHFAKCVVCVLHDFFVENVNNGFHQKLLHSSAHLCCALQTAMHRFCHLIQLTRTICICTHNIYIDVKLKYIHYGSDFVTPLFLSLINNYSPINCNF